MRITVEFEAALAVDDGPLGARRILRVASGEFEGPALRGKVLSGGDWIVVRRDGSSELDIRFVLESAMRETMYLRSSGLFVASDAVTARIRGGERVPPDEYYFRTSILFETGSAKLRQLNHALHLGVGQRTPGGMITDVFAVS